MRIEKSFIFVFNLQNIDFTELDSEQDPEQDSEQDSEQEFNHSKEDRPSMASMMDKMQKTLARRRAKNESGEVEKMADEIEHLSIDGTYLSNIPTYNLIRICIDNSVF